jgi:peptidoglycan/LPS O-acetylase OafA/YrhL
MMHSQDTTNPYQIKATDIANGSYWIDWLRGFAVLMIILHHWINYLFIQTNISVVDKFIKVLLTFTGNCIHIFFVISGAGLTISFLSKPKPWGQWYRRRISKILMPFWVAVTCTWLLINNMHHFFPKYISAHFDVFALLSNLVLIRNFFDPATNLSLNLWFIPIMIGLYAVFPLVIKIFTKMNKVGFLLLTLCISYGSIMVFVCFGLNVENLHSIFLFFLFEFSFGMYFGYCSIRCLRVENKRRLFGMLFAGFCIYFVSYALVKFVSWGNGFNKPFTALGLFLIAYAVVALVRTRVLFLNPFLKKISKVSYFMYLIHFPIVYYFLQPIKSMFPESIPIRFIFYVVSYVLFCGCVYYLSVAFEKIKPGYFSKVPGTI